jgi:tetratricopeptide (TPR) repeat protein
MPAFRAVLHALNVDQDGQAALAALDAYQRDFPSGTYRVEAYAARVNALILLGRRSEALSELESVSSSALRRMPHGDELFLLRAELLKERGDCATAMSTFNQVLEEGPAGLAERALWGRAGCRAAMGELEESRNDLQQYLRLFPNGVFSKRVRAALAGP